MQRTGPRVPVLWTRGPQPPAQRGVLWEMECEAAGRTGRCSPTTGRTRGPLGDGVRPQGLPQSTRKMEFPRPSNSPHIWLLLTARLEGGAAPGPIFTGGEIETCESGSQAPAFTRIPGASAAEPESPSTASPPSSPIHKQRAPRIRLLREPQYPRNSVSHHAQRVSHPGSTTASVLGAWPKSLPPIGSRRRCEPPRAAR